MAVAVPSEILSATEARPFKLAAKRKISHNVQLLSFSLPNKDDLLPLPVGRHLRISTTVQADTITRSYTPISLATQRGSFDLMIKVYDQGKMSKHMHHLEVGQTIDVKGPTGNFDYTPNKWKAITMLAGGSGITPMLQVARAVLHNTNDQTLLQLLYSNTTLDDILLKEEFDNLVRDYEKRFSVIYTLTKPPTDWKGETGRVNNDMLKKYLPPPSHSDFKIMYCGPVGFNKQVTESMEQLGYAKEQYYKF